MSSRCAGVLGVGLLLWSSTTAAAESANATVIKTAEVVTEEAITQGQILAASCYGCHAEGGASHAAIPSLQGLDQAVLVQRLNGYRTDSIDGTVMNRLAKGYTAQEIELLAEALSVKTP